MVPPCVALSGVGAIGAGTCILVNRVLLLNGHLLGVVSGCIVRIYAELHSAISCSSEFLGCRWHLLVFTTGRVGAWHRGWAVCACVRCVC